MSERIIWHTKPCSVSGHCLLIGPSTGSHELSVQMPIETAEFIVRACNSHEDLLAACERARNVMEQPAVINGLPDTFGDWITIVLAELETAIAKVKEN